MMSKEHMHNDNAARRVRDACKPPTPPRGAQMKRVMLAALRIDPSRHVLDNEPSEGPVREKLFRASPFRFRDGRTTCQSSNGFSDRIEESSRLIFCKQNCCVNQKKPIYDLNYWSNWK
jgi:hypothetical protein